MTISKCRSEFVKYKIALVLVVLVTDETLENVGKESVLEEFYEQLAIDTNFMYVGQELKTQNEMKRVLRLIEIQSKVFYQERINFYKKKFEVAEEVPFNAMSFKLNVKLGFLYDVMRDNDEAHKQFKIAYDSFINSKKTISELFNSWEVRGVADVLEAKLAQSYMTSMQKLKSRKC